MASESMEELQSKSYMEWFDFEDSEIDRRVYYDHQVFELEKTNIFRKVWIFVGFEEEIRKPGQFKTTQIGDTPIIVVRNKKSEIRVIENSCTHRGALLARENEGECSFFRCLYHQWSFDLDGELKAVPVKYREWLGELDCHNLSVVPRVETFQGLIFASYNLDIEPVKEYLANAAPELAEILLNGEMEIIGKHKWIIDANWKTYIENTCDGYHGTLLHRILGALAFNSEGIGASLGNGHGMQKWQSVLNLKERTMSKGEKVILNDYSVLETNREGFNRVMTIFPNIVVLQQADMINVRQVLPLSINETQVIALSLVPRGSSDEFKAHSAMQYANYFGPAGIAGFDDNIALKNVQMGVRASGTAKSIMAVGGTETSGGKHTEAQLRGIYKMWKSLMKV